MQMRRPSDVGMPSPSTHRHSPATQRCPAPHSDVKHVLFLDVAAYRRQTFARNLARNLPNGEEFSLVIKADVAKTFKILYLLT